MAEIDSGPRRRDCDHVCIIGELNRTGRAWEWPSTLTKAGNWLLATAKNLEWERVTGAASRILQLKMYVSLARSQ